APLADSRHPTSDNRQPTTAPPPTIPRPCRTRPSRLILPGAAPTDESSRSTSVLAPESHDANRLGDHSRLLPGSGRYRLVVLPKTFDLDGLLPGRTGRGVVRRRSLDLRLQYRVGTHRRP